jgi:hypothetical protein
MNGKTFTSQLKKSGLFAGTSLNDQIRRFAAGERVKLRLL